MPADFAELDRIIAEAEAKYGKKEEPPVASVKPRYIGKKLSNALAYAKYGMPVFVLHERDSDGECTCGKLKCESLGKHPRFKGWQQDATTDPAKIRAAWAEYPTANIGVACGKAANLTVLDVDGEEGKETLRQLELANGELPETPMVLTPRGGAHYYFKCVDGVQNRARFANKLDIRTEGGLVVGVGSKTSGEYVWEASATISENFRPAEMPGWLVKMIKAGQPSTNGEKLKVSEKPLAEGEGRNNELYRVGRSNKARGYSQQAHRASLEALNKAYKEPLEKDELEQIIEHTWTQGDRKDFQAVAQTNGHLPAEIEIDRTPVDAFDAYTEMLADQREYSWKGIVREGCTMVLSALMGSGKTTLSMNVSRGWALGQSVLDRDCKPSKTLVVVSSKEWDAWADTIGFWQIRGKIFLIPSFKVQFGDGREQALWFEHTMKQLGCTTFVLDTMFDFFGIPPHNTGDQNRMVMAEQTPLLEVVRTNGWSGIVTGHPPKSEAQAIVSRDPEESFGGHTAWSAQHRMRAVIRRKAKGASAIITGRGGYGDDGILEEHMLLFDPLTRLVSLGGKFANYLGEVALPLVLAALEEGGWHGRSDLIKSTGKGKNFVYAGIKFGLKTNVLKWNGKGSRSAKYALPGEPDEHEQMGLL